MMLRREETHEFVEAKLSNIKNETAKKIKERRCGIADRRSSQKVLTASPRGSNTILGWWKRRVACVV
jgi:hypothetical protein